MKFENIDLDINSKIDHDIVHCEMLGETLFEEKFI